MGMPVTVHVVDDDAHDEAADAVFADFNLLDRTFSPYIRESAVSRINRGELRLEDAGRLVDHAVDLCRLYERATDGYFSPSIDGRFDPSGLVKGWAIDRACSILDGYGYKNYFVDAGGDVQTRGRNANGRAWRIGIRHPIERATVARVVLASGLAVATSGTYEKGEHIVDPHTGKPANTWLSFTVVGPDILHADVYATAGCAMGAPGLGLVSRSAGYEAYAIDHQLRATYTAGFDALCETVVA
ncbi:MAG: FAD:protein FMN transferase [Candidatus Dormibacterales bacterium]